MNDPPPKEHSSQKSPSECQGSSREDEISHWDDSQLDGNSLLGRLLLLAEERQDYETFASPQSMGLLRWEATQQPKVQTPPGAQPQVQPQVLWVQPLASPRQPPLLPCQPNQPRAQAAPPVRRTDSPLLD